MDFNNLNFLAKLSSTVQFSAILLIFLGGIFQVSRFVIDGRISKIKRVLEQAEKLKVENTITDLNSIISQQVEKIEKQSKMVESQNIKLQEVELKTKSRSISKENFDNLKSVLSKQEGEKIEIFSVMGDQEAFNFATELKVLFQSSGWVVDGVSRAMYSNPIRGIIIVYKGESRKQKAENLFYLLNSIGFNSIGEINSKIKFDIRIVVGAKK